MRCGPIFGEDFPECANTGRHILHLDSQQQQLLGHMQDAVATLGNAADVVPGPLQQLTPPALPADRFPCGVFVFTRQPVGRGQAKHPLLHGRVGQAHRLACRAIVWPMPLPDYHRIAGVGRQGAPVMRPPVLRRPILVIGRSYKDGRG
jgi:hypothetical protein